MLCSEPDKVLTAEIRASRTSLKTVDEVAMFDKAYITRGSFLA